MSDRDAEASADFGCTHAVKKATRRLGSIPCVAKRRCDFRGKACAYPTGVLAERKRALCAGHA